MVKDGAKLQLGNNVLTAHWTPGHTRGCTSWALPAGKYRILFACSLTVAGQNLIDDETYVDAAADFRRSFDKLGRMKADIFLNFHPEFFDLEGKRAKQKAGLADAFVDPQELPRRVERAREGFLKEYDRQRRTARRS